MWFWCFATEYLSPATPFCSHSGRRVSAWLPVSQLIQVTFCVKPSLLKLRHLSATVCLWNFSQSCKVNLCYLCCYHYFLLEHRHLWYKSGLFLRSCWFLLLVSVDGFCWWFLLLQLPPAVVPGHSGWGHEHVAWSTSFSLSWIARQRHWGRFSCFVVVLLLFSNDKIFRAWKLYSLLPP